MRRFAPLLPIALTAAALSGCGGGSSRPSDARTFTAAQIASGDPALLADLDPGLAAFIAQDMAAARMSALAGADLAPSPERFSAMLSDATVASHGRGETNIGYFSPGGSFRIWREGDIVSGEWSVKANAKGVVELHLRFASTSGGSLGSPDVFAASAFAGSVREIAQGDLFNLVSGKPPFALPKTGPYVDLAALAAQAGGGATPQIRWTQAALVAGEAQ